MARHDVHGPVRSARILATILALVVLGAACSSDDDGANVDGNGTGDGGEVAPMTIGLLTDLSGPVATFGTDIQAASELAVEEINADGGVNGSMLELQVVDTGLDPGEAVQGLRDLATEQNAFAVSGPVSSGEAEVIFAQAPDLQIPMITATANQPGLTELGEGWAFVNTPTAVKAYAEALPTFALNYEVSRVALVYDDESPGPTATAELVVPAVAEQAGIEIVDTATFQVGATDFAGLVERVAAEDVDALFMMSLPVEAGLFAREMQNQGLDLPVLGFAAQGSGAFREAGGDAIHDWVIPTVFFPPASEAATEFAAKMQEADPEPPTVPEAANAYEIIYMIAQVAEDAGIDGDTPVEEAREAIRVGLLGLSGFEGPTGAVSFLENGEAEKTVYTLVLTGAEETELLE